MTTDRNIKRIFTNSENESMIYSWPNIKEVGANYYDNGV
jgi:hypothetical protein